MPRSLATRTPIYSGSRTRAALGARGSRRAAEDTVVLASENHPTWAIAYFAILKVGAVAVPIDGQSTQEDLDRIRAWSHAKIVLAGEKSAARLTDVVRIESLLESTTPSTALVHQPRGDDLASLIFTSGTTGSPKGVMLSHRNFTSLLSKLASVFDLDAHDGLLSVLPLHHTFEFSTGLLMPLMRGAQITYLPSVDADSLQAAFAEVHVTGMVGVPALFELFERNIKRPISDRGGVVERLFELVSEWMFALREKLPPALAESVLNIPRLLFWPIHQRFGGRLRLLISGGAALDPTTMKSLRGLGFNLYEGYGLSEAAPVLAVGRQRTRLLPGSVGEPLPGVTLSVHQPDAHGVGEIVAQAPNVMLGYFENEQATSQTLKEGWLHTGDLGRIEDGRLYIVGRKKELILGPSGENIYPDELEEHYRDAPDIEELCIVGLPGERGQELVAALVVPRYGAENREAVRERIRAHLTERGARVPAHKRLRVVHFTDLPLPRTATRKAKRRDVVVELQKLEAVREQGTPRGADVSWVRPILASVSGHSLIELTGEARIAALGFDSLMLAELGVALEAAHVQLGDSESLSAVQTVADLEALIESWPRGRRTPVRAKPTPELRVPAPLRMLGGRALDLGQRVLYEYLDARVEGRAHVPLDRPFLVAANHASHLDMGLVKEAIGDWGPRLTALAAKDYFFGDPIRRFYFESFTNLVPMDRHGSLRESLRLAAREIEKGNVLLVFPEGTRARDGVMVDFKPAVGFLALTHHVDVLPIYLEGTFDAMPSGRMLPRRGGLVAHVGPVLRYEALRLATAGAGRAESYRMVAAITERAVRALAPAGSVDARP